MDGSMPVSTGSPIAYRLNCQLKRMSVEQCGVLVISAGNGCMCLPFATPPLGSLDIPTWCFEMFFFVFCDSSKKNENCNVHYQMRSSDLPKTKHYFDEKTSKANTESHGLLSEKYMS